MLHVNLQSGKLGAVVVSAVILLALLVWSESFFRQGVLQPSIDDDDPVVAQRVHDLLHPNSMAKRSVKLKESARQTDNQTLGDEDAVAKRMKELLNPSAHLRTAVLDKDVYSAPGEKSIEPSCAVVDEQQRAEVMWICHVLVGLRQLFTVNVAKPKSLFIGVEGTMYSLVPRKVHSTCQTGKLDSYSKSLTYVIARKKHVCVCTGHIIHCIQQHPHCGSQVSQCVDPAYSCGVHMGRVIHYCTASRVRICLPGPCYNHTGLVDQRRSGLC
jgi:hypothetical protein